MSKTKDCNAIGAKTFKTLFYLLDSLGCKFPLDSGITWVEYFESVQD